MSRFPLSCVCDSPGLCSATGGHVGKAAHAECQTSERYRWVRSGRPRSEWPEEHRGQAKAKRRGKAKEPATSLRPPCVNLGTRPLPPADPNGIECHCAAKEVWRCDIHGRCTKGVKFDGVACCNGCGDYDDGRPKAAERVYEFEGPELATADHEAWCRDSVTREAFVLAYRKYLASIPPYPDDRSGRGIIYCGGGPKYSPGLYLSIRMLRHVGCTLPVQIWHRDDEEIPDCIRDLDGVYCVRLDPLRASLRLGGGIACRNRGIPAIAWQAKLIAGFYSGWREWMFFDADNYPVTNPTTCFANNPTGAVLWPDIAGCDRNLKWASYGVEPPAINHGTNGGTSLFDLSRCWRGIMLSMWFDSRSEYTYQHQWGCGGYGEQDTLRAGFVLSGTPYTTYKRRPRNRKTIFVQTGPDGKPMFVHRIADKSCQRRDNLLPLEAVAHQLIAEFRP